MDPRSRATEPPPLVIAGMHRSGTSLLSSILAAAGVNVGDELIGATESNRRGHFEDIDFHRFHQRVLAANGLAREGLTCRTPIDVPVSARPEALDIVSRRRAPGRLWGWKDPRTTLFLDFWADLLPDARFLFVFRPPWEVVDSLYRRGDEAIVMNPRLAVDVWCAYNRRILDFATAHPERSLVVSTESVATDPVGIVVRTAAFLGRPLATPGALFEPSLLVTGHPPGHEALVAGIRPDALPLHDALRRLAGLGVAAEAPSSDPRPLAEAGILEWVRAAAAERAGIASAAVVGEQASRLATLEGHLEAERAAARDLAARVDTESRDRAAMVTAWEEERRERDRVTAAHAEDRRRFEETLAARVHDLRSQAADREEERRRHHETIATLAGEIERLTADREADRIRHRETVEALERDLTSLAARTAAERRERDAAAAARDREVEARLAAGEALRRDLEESLVARTRDLASLAQARDADLEALRALERELEAATARNEDRERDIERALTGLRAERDAEHQACRAARDELAAVSAALARAERARQGTGPAGRDEPSSPACADREAALAAQLQAEREVFEALRQDMVARLDAALDAAA